MGKRYLIVVGDPTTGGGQALEGMTGFSIECLDGSMRNLACIGHAVLCGVCGMTRVAQGAPFFFINQPAAYDGCLLECGHRLIAASQRNVSLQPNTIGHDDASVTSLSNKLAFVGQRAAYDITFIVTGKETGKALPGVNYRITLDSGSSIEGTTDEHGLTWPIYSNSPDYATLEVLHDTRPTTCSGSDACDC